MPILADGMTRLVNKDSPKSQVQWIDALKSADIQLGRNGFKNVRKNYSIPA